MAIGADDPSLERAFRAILAVIPVTDHDRTQRHGLWSEVCPPAVVLESNEHPLWRFRDEVPDKALLPRLRTHIEDAEPRDRLADLGQVLRAEELVAAADQERGGSALDRLAHRGAVLLLKISADDVLALVLPAAEEEQVRPRRIEVGASGVGAHFDGDVAPAGALSQREHVAAIAVDAHEVRIEMRDAKVHHFFLARAVVELFFAALFLTVGFFAFVFTGSVSAYANPSAI